jgi:hypothetical protein
MFMTSKLRAGYKLIRKKLGFRYLMDVIPLDATLVKGAHGRTHTSEEDHPVFISEQPASNTIQAATDVYDAIWEILSR